jgi:biotin operon repressor
MIRARIVAEAKRMRNAEVIRQWKILKTVEAGRHTTTQALADQLGVTERTIRRDIEALQEAGFPLYDDREEGRKVWRLVPGYKQKLTQSFSLSELAALYFGKNLLSYLGGAPFAQDLESAFAKIREALPAKSLPYLARIQDLFSARPDPWKDYSKKQDVITALIDATLHQRQVRIAYFSFNSKKTKSYTLDPYRVVYYHGGLYLYARAQEYAEVRKLILAASPAIGEGIKWNAPSFRTADYFATFFLRTRDSVQLIFFHTGAKAKGLSLKDSSFPDPNGLIEWLAKDRCRVTLGTGKELKANRQSFTTLVKAWIEHL